MVLADRGKELDLAVPVLVESLKYPCFGRCVYTHQIGWNVDSLARCGHRAVPALLDIVRTGKSGGRFHGLYSPIDDALRMMRADAEAVVPQLVAALEDKSDSVRRTAAYGEVGTMPDQAAKTLPELNELVKSNIDRGL